MLEKSGTTGLALRVRIAGLRYVAVASDLRYSKTFRDLGKAKDEEKKYRDRGYGRPNTNTILTSNVIESVGDAEFSFDRSQLKAVVYKTAFYMTRVSGDNGSAQIRVVFERHNDACDGDATKDVVRCPNLPVADYL